MLLRELRDQGYDGGITQLKAFVRPYKALREDPVVRFETAPGEQIQADLTTIRRGPARLLAFVATLGWSRVSWVRFTTDERAATVCACMREALVYFGGMPRHVLFDNAGTLVIQRDAYGPGEHRWHPQMLAVAEEYGFGLRPCRPYRARTKGKVERFNGYLRRSFLVLLAASLKQSGLRLDAVAANAYVGASLSEVANIRLHAPRWSAPISAGPSSETRCRPCLRGQGRRLGSSRPARDVRSR